MNDPGGPHWALALGILLIVSGVFGIITGVGGYLGGDLVPKIPVVDWAGWIFLPCGIAITVLSIIALRRGEGKPKKYTDEDVARAKEALDRMYLREHGSLPEEPPSGPEEPKSKKDV
ncbi:MAG: hypothetical protein FWG04_04445 [Desulfovibrionaceae bacterium]|nr:hypothetical protein [Desulfovibrionaceae bacterium]